MLSFEQGRPIAIIKGGKYDGKIINLFDPDKKCCDKCMMTQKMLKGKKRVKCCDNCNRDSCASYAEEVEIRGDPFEVLDEDFIRSHKKKLSVIDMNKLHRALELNQRPLETDLGNIYDKLKEEYERRTKKELVIHDEGIVQALPNYENPERSYIAGPSGSGKSTYVSRHLEQLKKVYPKRDIFLFSDVAEDDVLDKLKPMRVKLDEAFLDTEITPESLKDSIVIFDDIDSIENDKIKNKVGKLRDTLLKRGRHEDISVVVTNHMLTDYKHTRTVLNEVNSITFFPKSGSSHSIQYMLKTYVGLSAKQIQNIFKLPSRWITVYKHYPMYVVYEKGIYLL